MNGLKTDTIINRDALYALRELPSESVHCAVTSPPYYALRDYGLAMQIGREDMFGCIFLQHFLLVYDTVAVTTLLIITDLCGIFVTVQR